MSVVALMALGGYFYFAVANGQAILGSYFVDFGGEYGGGAIYKHKFGDVSTEFAVTTEYHATTSTGKHRAMCANPALAAQLTTIGVAEVDSDLIKKVLLVTIGEDVPGEANWPLAGVFNWSATDPLDEDLVGTMEWLAAQNANSFPDGSHPFAVAHSMVGLLYGDIYGDYGASVGWSAEGIDKLRKGIELIRRFFERNPQHAPYVNNYRVYRTTFDRPGNDQDMVWLEGELDGKLSVRKRSADPGTAGNPNYSLAGMQFRICKDAQCNEDLQLPGLETDFDGNAPAVFLPAGTYYVEELVAPQGFLLSSPAVSGEITLSPGQEFIYEISNQPYKGGVTVGKIDIEMGDWQGQGDASLNGTQFGIYTAGGTHVSTISSSDGTASTGASALLLGDYYIEETQAGEGYNLNPQRMNFSITANGMMVDLIGTPFTNQVKRGRAMIRKCDLETGGCAPLGEASLDGTQFALINRSAGPVIVDGVKYAVGEEIKRVGAENTYAVFEDIPYGTYDMIEVVPGEGYLLGEPVAQQVTVREDTGGVHWTIDDPVPAGVPVVSNQVKRGDLKLIKLSADDEKAMAGVPFKIIAKATGEAHIIVTDVNGFASTHSDWNRHSLNTNQNDVFLTTAEVINADELDDSSGVWFGWYGEEEMSPVDDDLGALPYGVYEIEELKSTTNEGYHLMKKREFKIERDGVEIDLGTIENDPLWRAPKTGRVSEMQPAGVVEINTLGTVAMVGVGLIIIGGGVNHLRKRTLRFRR